MSENNSCTIKKIILSSASQTSVSAKKANTSISISSTPNCVPKMVKTSSHPKDHSETNLEL